MTGTSHFIVHTASLTLARSMLISAGRRLLVMLRVRNTIMRVETFFKTLRFFSERFINALAIVYLRMVQRSQHMFDTFSSTSCRCLPALLA